MPAYSYYRIQLKSPTFAFLTIWVWYKTELLWTYPFPDSFPISPGLLEEENLYTLIFESYTLCRCKALAHHRYTHVKQNEWMNSQCGA